VGRAGQPMNVQAINRVRTRQAQARIQAETHDARTAVKAAISGLEGDRWRLYIPKELQPCYGQPEMSKGESAFVVTFDRRYGI